MALPFLHLYMVARYYQKKCRLLLYIFRTDSAQAIQHFIKKSTLNLEHHTSASDGTKSPVISL